MRRTLLAVLCLSIALSGCKAKETADVAKSLEDKGVTDLMQEISKDTYTAPADGRLTDAQMQMYLKVREREVKIAQVTRQQLEEKAAKIKKEGDKSISGMMDSFKAMKDVANFVTADLRAAKELGYNTQEYLWVKGKILEVSSSAMAQQMGEAVNKGFDQAYEQTKKAYDEAKDETTRKMYGEMLAGYDKSRQEMKQQQEDPTVTYNRQIVSKYENALTAWTKEWAKYEDKPGEAQKAMADWQKSVDEAKKTQK
jgi:DNA-binding ferritin-like protein